MDKKRIALIFGGEGEEREVSLSGARFVFPKINREKYEVLPTYITRLGEWRVLSDSALIDLDSGISVFPTRLSGGGFIGKDTFYKIDCAIPLLHGNFGEDGRVQGLLDTSAIPYVGSGVTAGAISMDKAFTKALVGTLGIPTVRSRLLILESTEIKDPEIDEIEREVGYPLFVKPARGGSSFGASKALCKAELLSAIALAKAHSDGRILIEEYIVDRVELECAYFGTFEKSLLSPLGEITTDDFYDYETKYSESSTARVSALSRYEASFGNTVREWSEKIVELLGIRHLARLDFFLSGGRLYFNEINTFPGFTESSLYPRLISRLGVPPEEVIDLLISDALLYDRRI